MSTIDGKPTTLIEAIRYFSDLDVCTEFVANLRWPDGPFCPRCGSVEYSYLTTRRVWKCKGCKKQYSVKVGTVFEASPLGLDKWLPAVWLAANSKNGISSHELARALGVTQKSAWFMLHRIRLAMQRGSFDKLDGEVEADETYIGGKARNMHASKRKALGCMGGRTAKGKTAVAGVIERGGEARAQVVPDVTGKTLKGLVRDNVETGSTVYTDKTGRPTSDSTPSTPTRSSITPRPTWTGASTRTASKTSGRCSSADSTAPTSALSPSTCSATWTSGSSRSTRARWTTSPGSQRFSDRSVAGD